MYFLFQYKIESGPISTEIDPLMLSNIPRLRKQHFVFYII
jgi:hypothetical protein